LEERSLKYLKVTKAGIEIQEQEKRPTPEQLMELLEQSEPLSRTNYLNNILRDPGLVVLISNRWTLPSVAKTQTGEFLIGTVYIFRKIPLEIGYELGGLTGHQIASVQQELRLAIAAPQPVEAASCA
jgi:hypothetical protein